VCVKCHLNVNDWLLAFSLKNKQFVRPLTIVYAVYYLQGHKIRLTLRAVETLAKTYLVTWSSGRPITDTLEIHSILTWLIVREKLHCIQWGGGAAKFQVLYKLIFCADTFGKAYVHSGVRGSVVG
jgi:hypothetical protein